MHKILAHVSCIVHSISNDLMCTIFDVQSATMTHLVDVGYFAAVCRTTQCNDSAYHTINISLSAVKSHSRGYTVVPDSCDNVITSLTLSTTAVNMQVSAMN
jgi:hypothetical protein